MASDKEEKDMAMTQQKMEQMKEQANMKKLDAMLNKGIKRYDKALAKLAKN
ncbi:hypothetical protein AAHH67_15185 [Niallia circulans]